MNPDIAANFSRLASKVLVSSSVSSYNTEKSARLFFGLFYALRRFCLIMSTNNYN